MWANKKEEVNGEGEVNSSVYVTTITIMSSCTIILQGLVSSTAWDSHSVDIL